MVKNINSIFILKKIFSFVNITIKLKLVVYNKKIQHKLNINIIDYRRISGRYKIYDENGKIKEFSSYNDELIYEGEYLNGKRWKGKGKEYNREGDLVFEGEYLNGEKNGIRKEYNKNGNLIYEGEYLNGIKWKGKGKEYYNNGELRFEGEYLNDKEWKGTKYNTPFPNLTQFKYSPSYFNLSLLLLSYS